MEEVHQAKPVGTIARWLMPSLHSYTILVVLSLMIHSSWRFLVDSDTGWHIRTGEWILSHRSAPRHDFFSYTMAGQQWFAWEWLSDVLLALAYHAAGLAGVVAGAILVLVISFAALHRLMIWRGSDPLLALLLTGFAALASMVHWLARPHLLSILLMIIWYAMVESYRRHRTRWIYAAPVLVALWANLHGAFVATFLILGVYAVGEVVEFGVKGGWKSRELWRAVRTYAIVGALSLVTAMATPYGIKLYGHLWRYLSDRALMAAINEFQSPNFHNLDGKIIEVLLLLGAIAAGQAIRQGRFVEVGLLILLGHMTLQSERHVTIAAVLLTPFIAEYLTQLASEASVLASSAVGRLADRWRAIHTWYRNFRAIDVQLPGFVIYPAVLVFLVIVTTGSGKERWLQPHFDPKKFPVAAADAIDADLPSGNLYAHDQYGGYLIYRFYPRVRVFADGRSDLYRQGTVLNDMGNLISLKPSWSEILDRNNIQWMVLRRDEPLAVIAETSGKWENRYKDETAQIMVRKDTVD